MIYKAIGIMSGSSLDGLDIVYTTFEETAGKWAYAVECAGCVEYPEMWLRKLESAIHLPASEYMLFHSQYGKYIGEKINEFINMNDLHHKVNLIASHGHTTFHNPAAGMTHQLGDGAAIAAVTRLPVVSDLRNLDVAFGGQGAPIVPMGEKLLFPDYHLFLNIGGIANLSARNEKEFIAFDVCPANRVLNLLAADKFKAYDKDGEMAMAGNVHPHLLDELNNQEFYKQPYPKSLANAFGTDVIYPLIQTFLLSPEDGLRTYCEHIAIQIKNAVEPFAGQGSTLLITGGGAFNKFLVSRIGAHLETSGVEVRIPGEETVAYKEAIIMALLGVLRWREQHTVLASVTGATQNSIGGALWLGTEA